jgi:hypothetical protein
MNIYEAVEVMKILFSHRDKIMEGFKESALKGINALLAETRKAEPGALLRIIALMEHIHVDEAAQLYGDWDGKDIAALLADILVVNPVPDLLDGAFILGLAEEGWNDA